MNFRDRLSLQNAYIGGVRRKREVILEKILVSSVKDEEGNTVDTNDDGSTTTYNSYGEIIGEYDKLNNIYKTYTNSNLTSFVSGDYRQTYKYDEFGNQIEYVEYQKDKVLNTAKKVGDLSTGDYKQISYNAEYKETITITYVNHKKTESYVEYADVPGSYEKRTYYDNGQQKTYESQDEIRTYWENGDKKTRITNPGTPDEILYKYADDIVIYIEDSKTKTYYDSEGGEIMTINKATGEEIPSNKIIDKFTGEVLSGDSEKDYIKKAAKKAQRYMDIFHGMFLHTLNYDDVGRLLTLDEEEVCVSTVRSNTVFRNPEESIVLIGFGEITKLYDYDAYSYKAPSGKRHSYHDPGREDLFDLEKKRDFDESKYYDEGFMPWGSADVLIASIPRLEVKQAKYHQIDKIKDSLKQAYPGIKIINSEDFEKIKSSQQLLHILYRLKDERDSKQLMKGTFHKYEEKVRLPFKNFFLPESTVEIPINRAYEIFKAEYEKSTGTSWTYDKFMQRAGNWEFYGDMNGFVAVRRQNSGFVKLVGMAGSNKSKLKGIQELVSMNLPLWGMVSKDIKDIAIKKGMREPNFIERQVLKKSISPQVLGDAKILEFQSDGGIKLQYPDVGIVIKYLVGTPLYYSKLKEMMVKKFIK